MVTIARRFEVTDEQWDIYQSTSSQRGGKKGNADSKNITNCAITDVRFMKFGKSLTLSMKPNQVIYVGSTYSGQGIADALLKTVKSRIYGKGCHLAGVVAMHECSST